MPLNLVGTDCNGLVASGRLILASTISGTEYLNLQMGSANGTLELAGAVANTYTGDTSVDEGTLLLNKTGAVAVPGSLVIYGGTVRLQQAEQIGDSSYVHLDGGGTLDLNGHSETVGRLASSLTGGSVLLGSVPSAVLTVSYDAPIWTTFYGAISGIGNVTKNGFSEWDLYGTQPNTYIGTTTVNAGDLYLAKDGGAVPGNLVIAGTATVVLD